MLGVRIFSLLNIEPRIIVDMLESAYYISKKREIESELLVHEKALSTIDITQRIKDLRCYAMARFKHSIANRYKLEVRKVFTLDSIKSQSEEFLKEYPIVLSTTYSAKAFLKIFIFSTSLCPFIFLKIRLRFPR